MEGWRNIMKLAEALQERADLNTKISELRSRLYDNAVVQEGEKSAEDPNELLSELDKAAERLYELISRINLTNCATKADGVSLTELIAKKDVLKARIGAYRDLISAGSQTARRASRTEIKILSAVDVPALQKKSDELSRELRLTDNRIQELNWTTELK